MARKAVKRTAMVVALLALSVESQGSALAGDLRLAFEAEVVSVSGGGLSAGPLVGLGPGDAVEARYEVAFPFALDPFGSTVYPVDYSGSTALGAGGLTLDLAASADPRSQAVTFNPFENSIYAESTCATYLLRVSVWDPAGPPVSPSFDLSELVGSVLDFTGTLQPILFLEETPLDRLVCRVDRMRIEAVSLGTRSCSPAIPNSTGAPATLLATGTATPTSPDLGLKVLGLPSGEFVLFLVSPSQGSVPGVGGSAGTLCLGSPLGRFTGPGLPGLSGPAGIASLAVNPTALPLGQGTVAVSPGETWHFQAWYRDANSPQGSNLSDAVGIAFP
jgi:hypothetical protein